MGRNQYTTKPTVVLGRRVGLAIGNGRLYRRANPLLPLPVSQEWVFSAREPVEIRSRVEYIVSQYGKEVLAQLVYNLTWIETNSKYEAVREVARRWLKEMAVMGYVGKGGEE